MSNGAPASGANRRAEDQRFQALMEAVVDAVVMIDKRGRITRFSAAAERIFGYTVREVVGQNVSVLMQETEGAAHDAQIARYLASGEARIIGRSREVVGRRKDGTGFPLELSVGAYKGGAEQGFVGILRDLSDRRQQASTATEALNEAERLREKLAHVTRLGALGEMVSGIAHEVNQPLTAISTYASAARRLLQSNTPPLAEVVEILEKIDGQSQRAGDVIQGLRTMTRKQEVVQVPLEINPLVQEVSNLLEFELRDHGGELELKLAEGLPKISGDSVQIQQVLINLVRNGIEAMAGQESAPRITIRSLQKGDGYVEVQVRDTGPGVPLALLPHLFEPFNTSKADGMGLGLSICQSIMSAHGGTLAYTMDPAGGAVFTMRFPAT